MNCCACGLPADLRTRAAVDVCGRRVHWRCITVDAAAMILGLRQRGRFARRPRYRRIPLADFPGLSQIGVSHGNREN